jgi:hypothetical protein
LDILKDEVPPSIIKEDLGTFADVQIVVMEAMAAAPDACATVSGISLGLEKAPHD